MVISIIGAGYVWFTTFKVLAHADWSEVQEKMSDRNMFLGDTKEQDLNVIGVTR